MTRSKKYIRKLTYGQGRSMKRLLGFLIKIGVKHNIGHLELTRITMSNPGEADTWNVRVVYDDKM